VVYVANEAKHARASNVTIRVGAASGLLRVGIRDDGVARAQRGRGSGLVGLKDRAQALGGTVQSEQAAGTSLSNELPLTDDTGAPH
jgi:signal transduction histidine kinase